MATYKIVPERSVVSIAAKSNVHPVEGEARGLEGTIEADVVDGQLQGPPTLMEIGLPVERLESGNGMYDREMRRRIDVRKHPTIKAKATNVQQDGSTLHITGDVTFHGVTNSVQGDVQVSIPDDTTLVLEGESVFDIRDYGMEPPKILMLKVFPDVGVGIKVVAEKVKE